MKLALSAWVAAFSCGVQEASCRRVQDKVPLDAFGTDARVFDHSPISTLTDIYGTNKADTQNVALETKVASTVGQSHPQRAGNVALFTRPRQEQAAPMALLEGRHSDLGKDDKTTKDKHGKDQSNPMALLKDRHSDVDKPEKDPHSNVDKPEKDSKDKVDEKQSNPMALLKARHAHVGTKRIEEEHAGEEKPSTLSDLMSSFPADAHLAYWIVGGLSLLSCFCSCCLIDMVLKKENVKRQPSKKMQVRRTVEEIEKMQHEELVHDEDADEEHAGTPARDNSGWPAGTPARDGSGRLAGPGLLART